MHKRFESRSYSAHTVNTNSIQCASALKAGPGREREGSHAGHSRSCLRARALVVSCIVSVMIISVCVLVVLVLVIYVVWLVVVLLIVVLLVSLILWCVLLLSLSGREDSRWCVGMRDIKKRGWAQMSQTCVVRVCFSCLTLTNSYLSSNFITLYLNQ